jgi:hypothetical protein
MLRFPQFEQLKGQLSLSTLFDIIVSEIGNNLLRRYDYKTTTDICKIVEEPVRENIAASLRSTWTDDTPLHVTMKAGMLTTRPKMISTGCSHSFAAFL